MSDFQINLPNGAALAWKAPQDKGNQTQWFRRDFTGQEPFHHPNKLRRPLIGGMTAAGSGQLMALFDWDRSHMPPGMDEMALWAGAGHVALALSGVLFRSASGMPKVAVVMECQGIPTVDQLKAAMERLFEHARVPQMGWWDRMDSAMRQSFLDEDSARELGDCLFNAQPWRVEELFADFTPAPRASMDPSTELAEPLTAYTFSSAERAMLLVLQTLWGLNKPGGWGMSVRWLAREVGMSQTSAGNMLHMFEGMGFIRLVSRNWERGQSARRWAACGALAEAIEIVKENGPKYKKLPQTLQDGNSFAQLRDATWHFNDLQEYLSWVKVVQPVNRRNRWEKAESIGRAHFAKVRA